MTSKDGVVVLNGRVRAYCPYIGIMVVRRDHYAPCTDCKVFKSVEEYEEFAAIASFGNEIPQIICASTDKKTRCPACYAEDNKKLRTTDKWWNAQHQQWAALRSGAWMRGWIQAYTDFFQNKGGKP